MCNMKICTKCGEKKPLTEFYKDATSKSGATYQCKKCAASYNKARYENLKLTNPDKLKEVLLRWRKNNPEKYKQYVDECKRNSPEKLKASADKYRKNNPEKVKASQKKYQQNNPEKIHRRDVRERLKRKLGFPPPVELLEATLAVSLIKKELKNEHSRST